MIGMIQGSNVVKLKQNYIKEYVDMWLRKKARNSDETRKGYERDVKRFFQVIKRKELEFLTDQDLHITYDDFEMFIDYMCELKNDDGETKYNNKTINRNVSAVKELLKYLVTKKMVNDTSYFDSIEALPENQNSYGILSVNEVLHLADLAKKERNLKEVKYYFILFALDTCLRKSAILSLKWSDFEIMEDQVIIRVTDKGNKDFRKVISFDFYNELLTIKTDDERVFPISKKSIDEMMPRLVKQIPTLANRNIVFHSIRKTSISYQYRITSDILQAKKAAGHASIATTQLYLEEQDYGAIGVVSSKGNLNNELYKQVSHEELLEAISQMTKDQQLLLNLKLNQIQKDKKN